MYVSVEVYTHSTQCTIKVPEQYISRSIYNRCRYTTFTYKLDTLAPGKSGITYALCT